MTVEHARRAAAIGVFDGVHSGHRRVIDAVKSAGLRSTIFTFDPHPRSVLGGDVELLVPLHRRIELLHEAGVEDVVVLRFDAQLASLDPHAFAESVLRPAGVEVVAASDGFRFGHERAGDLDTLRALGFDVRRVPPVEKISSTQIRKLLDAGDVASAATFLGRPPEVEGTVVHGDHRGRLLGFPTANLEAPPGVLVPKLGIYAGFTYGHRAAISIGTNPTYGGVPRRAEAHLLGFDGDLYGKRLVVELWQHLRDEARFSSEQELVDAIAADCARARAAQRP